MSSFNDSGEVPVVSPAQMMPVQVIRREVIAPDAVTLYLVLPDTEQAPAPYQPGQFVTLALPTSELSSQFIAPVLSAPRRTLYRSYSLCGDGRADQPWEITIKRIREGAVSTYLYEAVDEGSLLYSSLPRGTFTLPTDLQPTTPLVFVAVGSGITPIMGMLSALALLPPEQRPQVQLHYASRSLTEMIYRGELHQLDRREYWLRRWFYLSSDGNRLTPETVLVRAREVALHAHWYTCGPESVKRDLHALLEDIGVPDEQIHAEIFVSQAARSPERGSTRKLAVVGAGTGYRLQIEETGAVLDVGANETLLAALERQGYHPDFSCRAGACGACKLRVLAGSVAPVGEALSAAERRAGYVLSCVAKPQGDLTLASGGRAPVGGGARIGAVPGSGVGSYGSHRPSVIRIRMAALAAVGGLMLGVWGLTNHMPPSLVAAAPASRAPAGAPTAQGGTPTGAATGAPTGATTTAGTGPTPTPQPGAKPTSTPKPGATAAPTQPSAPTATPKPQPTQPPAPTATPKPKPTATSTPS